MHLLLALPLALAAETERIQPPGFPFAVDLPGKRWSVETEGGDTVIACASYGTLPCFVLGFDRTYQPDLHRFDLAELHDFPLPDGVKAPAFRREKHARLGDILVAHNEAPVRFSGTASDVRVVMFPFAGGVAYVGGFALAGRGKLDARLDEVLDGIVLLEPAIPPEQQLRGHVELEAGFGIDLPEGWRAVAPREQGECPGRVLERGSRRGAPGCASFLDPGTEAPPRFQCVLNSEEFPPEVVAPERSERHAKNIRVRLAAMAGGGSFLRVEGGRTTEVTLMGDGPGLDVRAEDGDLSVVDLGDREGYLWRVSERSEGRPAALLYTAWDDVYVVCAGLAREGHPEDVDTAVAAFRTVRVTDGAAHPMQLELYTRYLRWWPYTHPALQLYWAVLGALAAAALWAGKLLFSD